jgi:hypothetical protein
MATLHEVIVRHGPDYLAKFGPQMPKWHRHALMQLMACRSFDAGRVYYECEHCGDWGIRAASCGHRCCAQCGHHKAAVWQEKQRERLLPVPYVMVTFTVPSELRELFKKHQLICYDLLFQESSGTLMEIAADPRHLGVEIGLTGVLHTWKRDLGYHPHVHYMMPAGGLHREPDGTVTWRQPKQADYLLPTKVLAVRMRNRMRERIKKEHPDLFQSLPVGAWEKPWNVNIQHTGQGETAFLYLARYVQSTAIRDYRIAAHTATHVTYTWVERKTGRPQKATVSGEEFIRRFLQHALPQGLMRVRHYGFLSAAAKKRFMEAQAAVAHGHAEGRLRPAPPPTAPMPDADEVPSPASPASPAAQADSASQATSPVSGLCCPKCQQKMIAVGFRAASDPDRPEGLELAKRIQLPSRKKEGQGGYWRGPGSRGWPGAAKSATDAPRPPPPAPTDPLRPRPQQIIKRRSIES